MAATTRARKNFGDSAERIAAMGNEPVGTTPGEFDAYIRQEIPKWAQVIRAAKITLAP